MTPASLIGKIFSLNAYYASTFRLIASLERLAKRLEITIQEEMFPVEYRTSTRSEEK